MRSGGAYRVSIFNKVRVGEGGGGGVRRRRRKRRRVTHWLLTEQPAGNSSTGSGWVENNPQS